MKTALAALIGSFALAGGLVEDACACSCARPDPAVYLERFDGAFVGTFVEKRSSDQVAPFGGRGATYVFDVERVAKGRLPATLHVVAPSDGAACGLEVPVGERIGLFVSREEGRWTSVLCYQVEANQLERAASDAGLELRPPLRVVSAGPKSDDGGAGHGAAPFVAAGLGAALLIGVVVYLIRRRRMGSAGSAA